MVLTLTGYLLEVPRCRIAISVTSGLAPHLPKWVLNVKINAHFSFNRREWTSYRCQAKCQLEYLTSIHRDNDERRNPHSCEVNRKDKSQTTWTVSITGLGQ